MGTQLRNGIKLFWQELVQGALDNETKDVF